MPSYLNISFNHFAAVQKWAAATGGEAVLDMRDFTMEVKYRGRYYRLYPLFQGNTQGRLVHLPQLTPDVRGFGGWRPYQTLTHPSSSDKQLFKGYLQQCGLRSPASWELRDEPPPQDYVLKARSGSFGRGLFGPYHGGAQPSATAKERAPYGELFAEQFIHGRMLKVWYWGAKPFFAHMQEYPSIKGDGRTSVQELLKQRMDAAHLKWESFDQKPVVLDCLAFQSLQLDDVLAVGRPAWIDYRYGQQYELTWGSTSQSDNQLEPLKKLSGDQTVRLGEALARLLQQTLSVPVMITVDGLLDAEGRIWWLEMNTNSLLPPEGYATMFEDLFP